MTRPLMMVLLCGALAIATGWFASIVPPATPKDNDVNNTQAATSTKHEIQWQEVLKKIPDYFTPVEVISEAQKRAQLEKERAVIIKPPPPITIGDARLVGVVRGASPKALIIPPKSIEPVSVSLNGVWLSPWQLQSVYADYVVWYNTETQETFTQRLFR